MWLEKYNIRKAQWKEYLRCRKNYNRTWNENYEAEKKIFTSVTFESEVTEYDWPDDAPCKRKLYNDFNGPVDSDNPPLPSNIFEYPSYCDNYPGCEDTHCQHYPNYLKAMETREKLEKAKEELDKAKQALKGHIK